MNQENTLITTLNKYNLGISQEKNASRENSKCSKDSIRVYDENHTLKIQQESDIQVLNHENEGDCTISDLYGLRLDLGKIFLTTLGCICTMGNLLIALLWSAKVRKFCCYKQVQSIKKATYICFKDQKNELRISKLQQLKETGELYFNYNLQSQNTKYIYNSINRCFCIVQTEQQKNMTHTQLIQSQGLKSKDIPHLTQKFGQCICKSPEPLLSFHLKKELCEPYFIIILFSLNLYTILGQMNTPPQIIMMTLLLSLINLYAFTKPSHKKLQRFLNKSFNLEVVRDNNLMEINNQDILPGEKILLTENMTLPCDIVLVQGELFVNESVQTGKGEYIHKQSLFLSNEETLNFEKDQKHILLEGTKIHQIKRFQKDILNIECYGIAVRTGFITFAGQQFKKVFSAQRPLYKFYFSMFNFVLFTFIFIILTYPAYASVLHQNDFDTKFIVFQFFRCMLDMVPIGFPILVGICYGAGLYKMKKSKIHCLQPERILPSESIEIMCFDKTGTLTEDKMVLYRVFDENMVQINHRDTIINNLLASCHMVKKVKGQVIGDQLEISMLQYVGAKIQNDQILTYEKESIKILKLFRFDQELSTMSVVVQIQNKYFIFCKGSPQQIMQISQNGSKNYQQNLEKLQIQGLRVLGIAYRELQEKEIENIQNLKREEIENNLNFKGLLGFQNILKKDSHQVIQDLQYAEIDCRIITGDDYLTSINCALQINILSPNKPIILMDTNIDKTLLQLQIIDIQNGSCEKLEQIYIETLEQYDQFVSTGDLLAALTEKSIQDQGQNILNYIENIMKTKTQIYARHKSQQKAQIIKIMQSSKKSIGMIGNGLNDCESIKQADLGISFKNSAAAFSSPFIYENNSIDVVPKVIQNAKCTMANVIDIFRIYIICNVVRFFANYLMLYDVQQMNIFQTVWQSVICLLPIGIVMAYSKSSKNKINGVKNENNCFGAENIFTILAQIIINVGAMLIAFKMLSGQSWYKSTNFDSIDEQFNKDKGQTTEFSVLNVQLQTVLLQTILPLLGFSYFAVLQGETFKKTNIKQKLICLVFVLIFVQNLFMIIIPSLQIPSFEYAELPDVFRWKLFILVVLMGILANIFDFLVKHYFGNIKRQRQFMLRSKQKPQFQN